MKLLILSKDYPRLDGTHERMFVHVRDLYYIEQGIDVTVLNFSCNKDYVIDNVKVICLKTYINSDVKYDAVVSHASNLRHHYRFLKKYEKRFKHIFFFFHGHEVLKLNEAYPTPYPYVKKKNFLRRLFQPGYDWLKLTLWKKYYKKLSYKSDYIFVSNWILGQFKKNTGLSEEDLNDKCHIINNSIGKAFEQRSYDYESDKKYDFITIRSNLDGSKYGVDLVVKIAENNPDNKFLLIGRGKFFNFNKKPDNIEWINRTLDHEEMFKYLNSSKCGLLLTREDTQGVMTCEFAAYGIPVITSDIEVCHEFFDPMENVELISNEDINININDIKEKLWQKMPYPKDKTYFAANTIEKEIELFHKRIQE